MKEVAILCYLRFAPLLQALWLNVDFGLDLRQAVVYRKYAFEENGTYHQWVINNTNPSTNYTETISHGYFQASCVIIFLPPLLATLLIIVVGISRRGKHYTEEIQVEEEIQVYYPYGFRISILRKGDAFDEDFSIAKKILKKCNIKINTEGGGSWIVLFCHPLLFLMEYFIQCLRYYLFTPLTSLFIGFAIALTGDFNLKEKFVFYIPYQLYFEEKIPVHLNYEHVFGAMLQFILSVVFLCNNYDFLLAFDTILGIPIPVSLISCIFSGVSLLMGIYSICKKFILFVKNL